MIRFEWNDEKHAFVALSDAPAGEIFRCGPVTDYMGLGPDGVALCVCEHGKQWPEGDAYEESGGAACGECSRASMAFTRDLYADL